MLEDRKRTNRILLALILGSVLLGFIAACTYKPQGCPIPDFIPDGSVVILDDVWEATILERVKVDCGVVTYRVRVEPHPIEFTVTDDRVRVPDCE